MSERFVSPCDPPEGLERELLTILAEECCEVAQRCTKALRFGTSEIQPGQNLSNSERIEMELGDVKAVIRRLADMGIIYFESIDRNAVAKQPKLNKYLQNFERVNSPPEGN